MFEKVCGILSEFTKVKAEDMTLEMEIMWDLGMNSFDILEAVLRFEDEFEIEVPDRLISSFRTVGDVAAYLEAVTKKNSCCQRDNGI